MLLQKDIACSTTNPVIGIFFQSRMVWHLIGPLLGAALSKKGGRVKERISYYLILILPFCMS